MKYSFFGLAGLVAVVLLGCSGGSGGTASVAANTPQGGTANSAGTSAANTSPGGYWQGTNSDGESIVLLVAENGNYHLLDANESQGSGVMSVGDADEVESNFIFVTQPGAAFPDGTTRAICSLAGTVSERQTMNVTVNCRTDALLRTEYTATLDYSDIYERDSSLATIAGNFQGPKAVLNITGDGTIFSQNPATNCIVNGQAGIIDSAFNAYEFEFTYSNCTGTDVVMNGASFVGIALINDRVAPQQLDIVAIGNLDGDAVSFEGNFVSFTESLERL